MSDDELRRLVEQMEEGWFGGGWSREDRRLFWNMLAEKGNRTHARPALALHRRDPPRLLRGRRRLRPRGPREHRQPVALGRARPRAVRAGRLGDRDPPERRVAGRARRLLVHRTHDGDRPAEPRADRAGDPPQRQRLLHRDAVPGRGARAVRRDARHGDRPGRLVGVRRRPPPGRADRAVAPGAREGDGDARRQLRRHRGRLARPRPRGAHRPGDPQPRRRGRPAGHRRRSRSTSPAAAWSP